MKKILLINTHMFSGGDGLYWSLASNPHIQGCKHLGERSYISNMDLYVTSKIKHKSSSKKSFYAETVEFSHLLSTKIDYSKFIVINFVREPKETLESIFHFKKLQPIFALRHYQYRLNRIYQISKVAKKSVFLNFNSSKEFMIKSIEKLTGLVIDMKENQFDVFKKGFKRDTIPKEYLEEGERCYERYHYLLKESCSDHSEESLLFRN
jgi:hypothetical protein